MTRQIELCLQFGDIIQIPSDVVALKYAQAFYGADHKIADLLSAANLMPLDDMRIQSGDFRYIECHGIIRARNALFVGTDSIDRFRYENIRQWTFRVMEALKMQADSTKHVALTLHGRGFGLDPSAAFLALLSGLLISIKNQNIPTLLAGISIVEKNPETYLQLKEVMEQRFSGENFISPSPTGAVYAISV